VFTSPACAQTIAGPSPRSSSAASASGVHAARVVRPDGDRVLASRAEQPERHEDRRVRVLADQHTHLRRAVEALGLHVPSRAPEHGVAPGGDPEKFAIVPPVVSPKPASSGRPRTSSTQRPETSSATAADGPQT
jgi:hypothetical protein